MSSRTEKGQLMEDILRSSFYNMMTQGKRIRQQWTGGNLATGEDPVSANIPGQGCEKEGKEAECATVPIQA